ncbi:hypothetical protein Goshw_030081 [Gossypium schwendimanii]|uniref:Uncharacterized protein n=1 Tax=Gossypium schwendimanii TaxID=34291 RepID=A0A7J9MEP5_GOSSC|nr:hypothetical protein [Gossypium schwendimanii]
MLSLFLTSFAHMRKVITILH